MDKRLDHLLRWLAESLGQEPQVEPASGDASFRRYFRVTPDDGTTHIAMDAPPDREDCRPFVQIAGLLRRHGLLAPEISHSNLGQGFLLLQDLGSVSYLDELNESSADSLYRDALDALLKIQQIQDLQGIPKYDRALLMREMGLFQEWFLGKHLDIVLDADAQSELQKCFTWLADNALAQPQVLVHRDYHSRNLMVVPDNNPGILDFQDACVGAITYDLVSLLRDCYISWSPDQITRWTRFYFDRLQTLGLMDNTSFETFQQWFDLMGAQRHLKAIGIFSRLFYRDGKNGYLPDIPRTMAYLYGVTRAQPALEFLKRLLEDKVLSNLDITP